MKKIALIIAIIAAVSVPVGAIAWGGHLLWVYLTKPKPDLTCAQQVTDYGTSDKCFKPIVEAAEQNAKEAKVVVAPLEPKKLNVPAGDLKQP